MPQSHSCDPKYLASARSDLRLARIRHGLIRDLKANLRLYPQGANKRIELQEEIRLLHLQNRASRGGRRYTDLTLDLIRGHTYQESEPRICRAKKVNVNLLTQCLCNALAEEYSSLAPEIAKLWIEGDRRFPQIMEYLTSTTVRERKVQRLDNQIHEVWRKIAHLKSSVDWHQYQLDMAKGDLTVAQETFEELTQQKQLLEGSSGPPSSSREGVVVRELDSK